MTALLRICTMIAVLIAVVPLCPSSARCEEDATLSMARERFKEGVKFFDKRQFDKARVAFLQAYALKSHPAVLLNLAQSELRSEHEVDAARHFAQYLREHTDATEEQREAAIEGHAAAKAQVGEVQLDVDAEGAQIWVDGEEYGRSPLRDPLYVSPGNHTIVVKKEGHSAEIALDLNAGESVTRSVRLAPATAAAPAPSASLEGAHDDVPIPATTSGSPSFTQSIGFWVSGGVAVVGLGVGAGFALAAKSSYESADNIASQIRMEVARVNELPANQSGPNPPMVTNGICLQGPDYFNSYADASYSEFQEACRLHEDNVSKGDNNKKVAIAGFVVGGVAAAAAIGTVIYYAVSDDSSAATEGEGAGTAHAGLPVFFPVLAPGMAGISVSGHF